MAIFTEQGLTNTAKDNEWVKDFLAKQPKANLIDSKTGKLIKTVPIITMMSDYKWQLDCLNDRINNPEKYRDFEDVDEAIKRLQAWLASHEPEPEEEQPTEPENIYVNGFRAIKEAV